MTITTGYITYYWSSSDEAALTAEVTRTTTNDNGQSIPVYQSLGVAQGGVVQTEDDTSQPQNADGTWPQKETGIIFGISGTFYTVVRTTVNMKTPSGLSIADPFDCTGLLGVFA